MPDDADSSPSVLVIDRSATGAMMLVSVASLLPVSGSVVPVGAVTVAVFETVPLAEPRTVASTAKVTEPDGARSTVAEMSPVPFASSQNPPVPSAQVHVAPVSSAGIVSVTTASNTADGPSFVTTIV